MRAYVGVVAPDCVWAVRQGAGYGYWYDSSADASVVGFTDALVIIWRLRLLGGSAARAAVRALISDWDDEFGRVGVPLVINCRSRITGGHSRVIAP